MCRSLSYYPVYLSFKIQVDVQGSAFRQCPRVARVRASSKRRYSTWMYKTNSMPLSRKNRERGGGTCTNFPTRGHLSLFQLRLQKVTLLELVHLLLGAGWCAFVLHEVADRVHPSAGIASCTSSGMCTRSTTTTVRDASRVAAAVLEIRTTPCQGKTTVSGGIADLTNYR